MNIFRSLILFYIGFIGHVLNVLADDLNIQSLLVSEYSINTSEKIGALYTVIKPFKKKTITRVLDGRAVVWESQNGEVSRAVTIIHFPNTKESLMNIEILEGSNVRVNYYSNSGSFYAEVTPEAYQKKLENLSAVKFELHDVQVVKRKTSRKYDYEPEQEEQQPKEEEVNYELEDLEEEVEQHDLELGESYQGNENEQTLEDLDLGDSYQENENEQTPEEDLEQESEHQKDVQHEDLEQEHEQEPEVKTKSRRSLRRNDKNNAPKDSSKPKEDRILDITKPEENRKVIFEYEINDGTPTLCLSVKKGKKITTIFEANHKIWQGGKHARLVYMNAFKDYADFRLVEIFYLEKDDPYHRYFRRNTNGWEEVNVAVYEETFVEMKKKIEIIDFIGFNISKPDSDKFYEKVQKEGKYDLHTYFPRTGYHLKQVGEGDKLIWESHERRCLAVVVAKDKEKVRLLKLEILKAKGTNKIKYYKKKNGKYEEICEGRYEQLLRDKSPGFEDDDSEIEAEVYKSLLPDVQDKLKMHDIREEEQTDQKSPGSKENAEELQILNPTHTRVEDSVYRGLKFKTFFATDEVQFTVVKVGDSVLWEAQKGEYTQFLRMFYQNGEPKLGFLKLSDGGLEPKDKYFINEEGFWNFVTPNYFLEVFDGLCDKKDQ